MKKEEEIKPFTTDGCSGGMSYIWKLLFKTKTPWEDCCVDHDKPYHTGGTKEERKTADKKLCECVTEKGYKVLGWIMEKAVRVGGHPWIPTPWRWGYGYKYPRSYTKKK